MFGIRIVIAGTTTAAAVTAAIAVAAAAVAAAAAAKRTQQLMLNVALHNGYAQRLCFPHGLKALLLVQPTRTFNEAPLSSAPEGVQYQPKLS